MFPCNEAGIFIPGPAGKLEARTQCPREPAVASAVICHPHPLEGGTLTNKVVHTLARAFVDLGLRAVRFNFRGVGLSAGAFADSVGETDDALAVLEWVRLRAPEQQIWLAGFSFGAYVGIRACQRYSVNRLVTVAPPVNLYDMSLYLPPPVPWLVIQGEQDEIVPAESVAALVTRLGPPTELRMLKEAGHFFHKRLNDLHALVVESLRRHVPRA